jgi:hypothetical protein
VALRGQVVHLVRHDLLDQPIQVVGVDHVAVVQEQALLIDLRVGVHVLDARAIEGARASNDAVHLVALAQQKLE